MSAALPHIRLPRGFPRDERLRALARRLTVKPLEALALVVAFYDWLAEHRPTGNLDDLNVEDMGRDIGYDLSGINFLGALADAKDGDGRAFISLVSAGRGKHRAVLTDYAYCLAPSVRGRERLGNYRDRRFSDGVRDFRIAGDGREGGTSDVQVGNVDETHGKRFTKQGDDASPESLELQKQRVIEDRERSRSTDSRATSSKTTAATEARKKERDGRMALMAAFDEVYERECGGRYRWRRRRPGDPPEGDDWGRSRSFYESLEGDVETFRAILDLYVRLWRGGDKHYAKTEFAFGTVLGHLNSLRARLAKEKRPSATAPAVNRLLVKSAEVGPFQVEAWSMEPRIVARNGDGRDLDATAWDGPEWVRRMYQRGALLPKDRGDGAGWISDVSILRRAVGLCGLDEIGKAKEQVMAR